MKHLLALPLVLVICALPFLVACPSLGPKVDDLALFEPAQVTWSAVENDLLRGIEDGVSEGDLMPAAADNLRASADGMELALREKDRDALRLSPWSELEPWADRGIDDKLADGEIGPGVASSLREQLANFTNIVNKLRGL
tara:strand:- start:7463 stop:7882 length:420 start_codon:yes stop_codon:yes gene_type:complete